MRILVALLFASMVLGGCADTKDVTPAPIAHTPLELDPTEEYELARWWTNGDRMLRLDRIGSYALHGDMNRYHRPIERGRWSQQSYAVLRLEPYSELPTEALRVQITKINGKLALVLRKQPPMFALLQPPRVLEDDLLGAWAGDAASLDLFEDLTYDFNPTHAGPEMLGHTGRWRVLDTVLILQPRTAAVAPVQFEIGRQADCITLSTPDMVLRRP